MRLTLEKIKKEWVPGETEFWYLGEKRVYAGVNFDSVQSYDEDGNAYSNLPFNLFKTNPPEEDRWIWQVEDPTLDPPENFRELGWFASERTMEIMLEQGIFKRAKKLRKMEAWDNG